MATQKIPPLPSSPVPASTVTKRGRGRPRKILLPLEVPFPSLPAPPPPRDGMTVRGTITETGERVNIEATLRKEKYAFKGVRYVNMGIMEMTRVLRLGLTRQELTLTFWLGTIMRKGNVVVVRYKDTKQFCPVARSALSRTLSKLVKKRVLRRESSGTFTMNPHFMWIGSAKEHKEFVKEWDLWEAEQDRIEKGLELPIAFPVEQAS